MQTSGNRLGYWKKVMIATAPVLMLVFGNVFLAPIFLSYPLLLGLSLSAPLAACLAIIFLLHRLRLNDVLVICIGLVSPWITWAVWADFAISVYAEHVGPLPRLGGR